jgi:hypothetical protein
VPQAFSAGHMADGFKTVCAKAAVANAAAIKIARTMVICKESCVWMVVLVVWNEKGSLKKRSLDLNA